MLHDELASPSPCPLRSASGWRRPWWKPSRTHAVIVVGQKPVGHKVPMNIDTGLAVLLTGCGSSVAFAACYTPRPAAVRIPWPSASGRAVPLRMMCVPRWPRALRSCGDAYDVRTRETRLPRLAIDPQDHVRSVMRSFMRRKPLALEMVACTCARSANNRTRL